MRVHLPWTFSCCSVVDVLLLGVAVVRVVLHDGLQFVVRMLVLVDEWVVTGVVGRQVLASVFDILLTCFDFVARILLSTCGV